MVTSQGKADSFNSTKQPQKKILSDSKTDCSSFTSKNWAESVSLNIITAWPCIILPVGDAFCLGYIPGIGKKTLKEGKWEVCHAYFQSIFQDLGFSKRKETDRAHTISTKADIIHISHSYHIIMGQRFGKTRGQALSVLFAMRFFLYIYIYSEKTPHKYSDCRSTKVYSVPALQPWDSAGPQTLIHL